MSFKAAARVKETTTTTGTGTLQLAGAVTDFQTFVAGIGDTNQCSYMIFESGTGAWERGIGTVAAGAPDTLSRDIVLESTNGDAKVNLAAGAKDVFVDLDPQVFSGSFINALAKSGNYTVTLGDAGALIEVTTGASDVTVSLMAIADVWRGWSVTVRKVDTGAGKVIVDANGAELIDGYLTRKLWSQYDEVQLIKGSGASWSCRGKIRDRLVTFTGSGTWTKQDGLQSVDVEVQGGGGSGGSGNSADNAAGSGGAAGGYARKYIAAAALGATESVTVGAGGAASGTFGDGNNGGTSSFGSHCSATGGNGGVEGTSGTATTGGNSGGSGSGGDLNISGQGGTPGSANSLYAGGGGSSMLGLGARGAVTGGIAGTGYGSGSSGARRSGGTNRASVAGQDGIVIVRERYA